MFIHALAILTLFLATASPSGAADEFVMQTATYKSVDGIDIMADVYRPDDMATRPVVVWIHGGALINGSRKAVPRRLSELCREEGFALVSLDYRLAPEVKIQAIIEDIQDAFRWMRAEGAERFHLDAENIVVTGGSAGGYLTMMTGYCVCPRPRALVAYWGYGEVDGTWYTEPSPFYRGSTPLISKEEAYSAVGKTVVPGVYSPDSQRVRGRYYVYLRQNGLWTKEVTGLDPATQKDRLDYYCPVRNISPDYPPILMLHGVNDTDVPYQKSVDMAAELKKNGVKHQLITVENAGHGLAGGDPGEVNRAHAKALEFIRECLKDGRQPSRR